VSRGIGGRRDLPPETPTVTIRNFFVAVGPGEAREREDDSRVVVSTLLGRWTDDGSVRATRGFVCGEDDSRVVVSTLLGRWTDDGSVRATRGFVCGEARARQRSTHDVLPRAFLLLLLLLVRWPLHVVHGLVHRRLRDAVRVEQPQRRCPCGCAQRPAAARLNIGCLKFNKGFQ
jgi:hypothetical protein